MYRAESAMNAVSVSRGHPAAGGRWIKRIAVLTGFALLPGLLTSVAFGASSARPLGKQNVAAAKPDKVSPFTAKVDKKNAAAVKKAAAADRAADERAKTDQGRAATWPKAGTARLTMPSGGSASADAGSLPVTVAQPEAAKNTKKRKAVPSVAVRVRGQEAARAIGLKGVILTATAPASGGSARLGIDYSAFAAAYGGDWAGRLQVAQLPACALTTPQKATCRTLTPLRFVNHRQDEQLQADLTFPTRISPMLSTQSTVAAQSETMVLAVSATAQSGAGDYKATPLSASSTWEAGGSSGSFTWSYPLRVPPAAAGPSPDLTISYDSGSVDGKTANTNSQSTLIGEGFDLTSSYIERKYGSCDDDGQDDKFDLCWKYDNASLVLNGKATELVKDDTTGVWRLKDDDASTVTHSTGADNDDDGDSDTDGKGEYWTVTTGDGTKYVFGLNKLPGAGASDRTNSVWTVPVFGDDSGEPGYSSGSSYSGRWKKQAWRWNLDYVVDTHDNAMSYWYTAETNYYLRNGATSTQYTRGGYPSKILYGQRADALFPSAAATAPASDQVAFTVAERCIASGTGCDSLDDSHRDNWPDVPFDSICTSDDACTGHSGPTFFTRKRITGVATSFWDAAATTPGFSAVDSWALTQTYLDPGDTGDSSDQSLWLDQIKHTGKHGTDISLDAVQFDHEFHPNRVDGASDDILSLEKPRLKTVTSETGAQTIIDYAEADCTAGGTKPALDSNTKRCYPVYWSPNGATDPQLDWFQKYPVTGVRTTDPKGGAEAVAHTYSYSGGGAWHYNDDPMTPEKERTWSSWRGFGKVTHLTGVSEGTQSKTVTVYMRGMNGDRVLGSDGKLDATARRSATVTGIKATEITDSDQYAGFTRESVTYNGADEVSGTINDPWSKRTATQHKSYAETEAYYVRTGASHARANITSGVAPADRVRTTATTFDTYGMASTVEDKGDDSVTGDEKCTRTWYARNDTAGINSLVARTRVVAKNCDTTDSALDLPANASSPGDVISDTAVAYDTTTWSDSQTPTKGEAQWAGRAKGYTTADAPTWQKVTTATYDKLGRPKTAADALGQTTASTSYIPDDTTTGPLTSTTTTNAKTYATTTAIDPAWGTALKVTDANSKVTQSTYDSLGRVTQTWLPNRSKALGKTPNYVFGYSVTSSDLSSVSTGTLKGDGSGYNTTYELYDSLLRLRQTQTPSPAGGQIISETLYDARGLAVTAESDIWDNTTAPNGKIVQVEGGAAPIQTDTTYDGAGRPTKAVTKTRGTTRWTTATTYTGDTVATSAPAGGSATAVVTNVLGQTTSRREYASPSPTGTPFTTTGFTYYPGGQQKTITGPDSAWSYTYDLFGRQLTATDPDKGKITTAYNELDQITSTTDARNSVLLYEYDVLGRKTDEWETSKTDANKLAHWGFDSVAKGQADTSTRYVGGVSGKAYTKKVTAYDSLYRATATQLLLPSSDPLVTAGVASTLSLSTAFNLDGTVSQAAEPAAGGLAAETVSYTYNAYGQQLTSKGTTGYLQGAAYTPQGDLNQLTLGVDSLSTAKKLYLNYSYEAGTRRLTRSLVTDDTHGYTLQDLQYTQDDAGNLTSIFDVTTAGGTGKTDNQCFAYDGYRRLTQAWTPSTADCAATGRTTANLGGAAAYWSSYSYNTPGLRTNETQHTTSGDTSVDYAYGTSKVHQLASTKTTKPDTTTSTQTYAYDSTGNTTVRPGGSSGHTLDWNTEGKLSRTTTDAGPITGLSSKCLSIQGAATTAGTPVEISACASTNAQKWRLAADGTLQALNVCAAPSATASGSAVQIKTCSTTDVTQQWKQRDDGTLYNPNSGRCLLIPGSSTTDGTDLQLADCDSTSAAQQWTVTKQTQYLYDADGILLIRRAAADGETVLYLGATEIHLTVSGTTKALSATRSYAAAGQTIAVRTSSTQLTFLAGDNHGTASIASDASTQAFTKRYTSPFGASRGNKATWPDDKTFLGKPTDTTTSLTHVGAREYDPTTGRFISVDPVLNANEAQSLNGYTYANNNPVTLADPSGLDTDINSCVSIACYEQVGKEQAAAKGEDGGNADGDGTASSDSTGSTDNDRKGRSGDDLYADQVRHDTAVEMMAAYLRFAYPNQGVVTEYSIPGSGPNGGNGEADLALIFDDTIFLWEVKSVKTAEPGGRAQLQRYVDKLNESEGDKTFGRIVRKGFELPQVSTVDPLDARQDLVAQSTRTRPGSKNTGTDYQGIIGWWTRRRGNDPDPPGQFRVRERKPNSIEIRFELPQAETKSLIPAGAAALALAVIAKAVSDPLGIG